MTDTSTKKSEIRIKIWTEIQLHAFTLIRIDEYFELICYANLNQNLYY
jgi:hypothetical protein